MATERLSMRKTKEVLRQKWVQGLSYREIARSQAIGEGTVSEVLRRAKEAGLVEWAQVEPLDETELERRLYAHAATEQPARPLPDWAELQAERHKPGVTLELLHHEYLEKHADGYQYSHYRATETMRHQGACSVENRRSSLGIGRRVRPSTRS